MNLLQKLNVLIAQAVLGGKMELQNRERSFTSYKAKEVILKKARRIKPEVLNIFEDLGEEKAQLPQLKQPKGRGKLAYFSLVKLGITRDTPNGSTNCSNV